MDAPAPGTYRRYRGQLYEVLGVARHSETREEYVIYRALYDSKEHGDRALWVRPKAVFLEPGIVEGPTIPRYTPIARQDRPWV